MYSASDARALRLLKRVLDGVLALVQHAREQRPAELGEDRQQDEEGDEHRHELDRIGQDRGDAARGLLLRRERERRERGRQGEGAGEDPARANGSALCFAVCNHVLSSFQPWCGVSTEQDSD